MGGENISWRLGIGAEVRQEGVFFRVWAPKHRRVAVVLERERDQIFPLAAEQGGYFSGTVHGIGSGTLYRYRLDEAGDFPDPCSRFQPEGPEGPSQVIDPGAYRWEDGDWKGMRIAGQVLYELHVGTFTPEGSWDAARRELAELKRMGVTVIEIMPIAEFPGRWNWGYDGVDLYAPSHTYGGADALRHFVDTAHRLGLGIILDVVYNHLGCSGCYLKEFSDAYFTDRYKNDWGEAINFDGPESAQVREFFIRNACYWISEFHMDGLRLDAIHQIFDSSTVPVLGELTRRTRRVAADSHREIILIAENLLQQVRDLLPVDKGGYGLDAVWNDDFHHSARVALTGRREGYYSDYRGAAQELLSVLKRGFLFQGQPSYWTKSPRGSLVTSEPASAFIIFIQNHDQVGNHLSGARLHALSSIARFRAISALLLLAPETPLLFMGQEFAASSPFHYFADHPPELSAQVHRGRRKFLSQFLSFANPEAQRAVPDPSDPATFEQSKLQLGERDSHRGIYLLHQDLLRLRRDDPVIALQSRESIEGAVLGPGMLVLRFAEKERNHRLLAVNLGADVDFSPATEPLLAPSAKESWRLLWSSDDPRYGGPGALNPCGPEGWRFPAESTSLLAEA